MLLSAVMQVVGRPLSAREVRELGVKVALKLHRLHQSQFIHGCLWS